MMEKERKALAVIPARGGSKGLPRKNIRNLCGKPLIAYTIEAALASKVFDTVMVSTDDAEIAEVSKKYGAEVPFLRPESLSGDKVSSDFVAVHALKYYLDNGICFDDICKLQPTSPLRTAEQIKESYFKFLRDGTDYMVSICKCEHSPLWSLTLDQNGRLDRFIQGEQKDGLRQALPDYYRLNGAIYWACAKKYLQSGDFCGDKFLGYIMDRKSSIDIDSEDDLKLAEFYIGNN